MAKNYIQAGDHITIPAAANAVSGEPVLVGSLFGVAEHDAAAGEPLTIARKGVFLLPKATGAAWAVGDPLYWDDAASAVSTTDTDNPLIGVAVEAALDGATEGVVLLDGAIR